uniref:Acyl-CoA dehydrogenase/oxidase C-terminal domain-containing protein n=1 Tax=Plectus sambesii TaxID=2011161 RepID=A0A914VGL9_9BILA
MLNITRMHNAVASVSSMRRIISLARDYAQKRIVFGRVQADWPLHLATIARMEVETRGCLLLLLESARLLGLQEMKTATDIDLTLLRLITPLLKLYTAKQCMTVVSEGLECFGGQGYIEDTGLPGILRDAQVTPIWEGTTNVLSLDVLRVFAGAPNSLAVFAAHVKTLIGEPSTSIDDPLSGARKAVSDGLAEIAATLKSAADRPDLVRLDQGARFVAFALSRVYAGALLIAHARDHHADATDKTAAHRFCCEHRLVDLRPEYFQAPHADADRAVVYDRYVPQKRSQFRVFSRCPSDRSIVGAPNQLARSFRQTHDLQAGGTATNRVYVALRSRVALYLWLITAPISRWSSGRRALRAAPSRAIADDLPLQPAYLNGQALLVVKWNGRRGHISGGRR